MRTVAELQREIQALRSRQSSTLSSVDECVSAECCENKTTLPDQQSNLEKSDKEVVSETPVRSESRDIPHNLVADNVEFSTQSFREAPSPFPVLDSDLVCYTDDMVLLDSSEQQEEDSYSCMSDVGDTSVYKSIVCLEAPSLPDMESILANAAKSVAGNTLLQYRITLNRKRKGISHVCRHCY